MRGRCARTRTLNNDFDDFSGAEFGGHALADNWRAFKKDRQPPRMFPTAEALYVREAVVGGYVSAAVC